MALVEVKVPDIGDFKDVEVIELLVKPGDTVAVDQSLLTVESDKASMEIPSSHAGTVFKMLVNVGDKVRKGSPIALTGTPSSSASSRSRDSKVGRDRDRMKNAPPKSQLCSGKSSCGRAISRAAWKARFSGGRSENSCDPTFRGNV